MRYGSLAVSSLCSLLSAIGLVLVAACDRPPEAYQPEPNVYCILRPGKPQTLVMAGMSVTMDDTTSDAFHWYGVRGVAGNLRNSRNEASIHEVRPFPEDTLGYYRSDSFAYRPGDTCFLDLTYPGGEQVHGVTIVPDSCPASIERLDTVLLTYYEADTYSFTRIRATVRIPRVNNAAAYRLQVLVSYGNGADTLTVDYGMYPSRLEVDTVYLDPFTFDWQQYPPESLWIQGASISVTSADRNFAAYYPDDYMEQPKMNLDGALGVFASLIATELKIVF